MTPYFCLPLAALLCATTAKISVTADKPDFNLEKHAPASFILN